MELGSEQHRVTPSSGGGGGAGKATFSDLNIMKTLDKSLPKLFEAVASGEHIREVKFSGTTDTTNKKTRGDYFIITLTDVIVTRTSRADQVETADPRKASASTLQR
ncbi:type VI secretion system tube protein Hcp [Candidatus Nitrososphaera gargensis]|nr:type VI secretion system tube protein Hcp [Candidatus Nitrososphaera gargensis]